MSYLEHFTQEQRELLVSLPYRVGLWVSESDQGGGDHSSEAEMQTLETLIMGYAEDFLKSEFVEEVMRGTLARKETWPAWSRSLDNVPQQCQAAINMMQDHIESKDVLSFRQTLMEVARAIAMAYRELDEQTNTIAMLRVHSLHYWLRLKAYIRKEQPPSLDEIMNISRSEHKVLQKLATVLKVDMHGNPLESLAA